MARPETATPATACSEPALNFEQLGGQPEDKDAPNLSEIQAFRLQHRFGFAYATAIAISALAFAAGPR